jgi:RNA polymerase sigma-70 factor (ECF subfamily)
VKHRAALCRYVARLIGDDAAAEDVVQEALTRFVERPPERDDNPRAWLFAVATNLALDDARTAWRRARLLRWYRDWVPGPRPEPDPEASMIRAERAARVRTALAVLSEKERTVLLMREEGFKHREIAQAVGTTTRSVGTLVARALDKLARRLTTDVEAS